MDAITVEPASAQFPASGGVSSHQLTNPGEARLALKIKCSNNDAYRLNPVYAFVEPNSSVPIEITRLVSAALNHLA